MHIYGAYPGRSVKSLHKPEENFYIRGRAKDAEEVVGRARVVLAPLRFGAGLKGKLTEAMICGTPSVTTPVGAEGISGNLEWPGAIADRAEGFAENAIKLYNRKEIWQEAQINGFKVINGRFLRKTHGPLLIKRINEIQQNLENLRHCNFVGSMLMHHTMASTKFMSRWIEAKNKIITD